MPARNVQSDELARRWFRIQQRKIIVRRIPNRYRRRQITAVAEIGEMATLKSAGLRQPTRVA